MKSNTKKKNILPFLAAAVLIVATAVTLIPDQTENGGSVPSVSPAGDLVIQTQTIGSEAGFFNYDAGGTTVQVLAVRASDGTTRLALNTCQVCAGSPYAYFVQDGDSFICQNCQNRFASTQVGIVNGGCNPVPITDDIFTEQDGTIIIPASFLDESAELFQNWKKF